MNCNPASSPGSMSGGDHGVLRAPHVPPMDPIMWVEKQLTDEDDAPCRLAPADDALHAFKGAGRPRNILFVSWRDLANPMAGGSELLVHQLASGLARATTMCRCSAAAPLNRIPSTVSRTRVVSTHSTHEFPFITFDRFGPRISLSKCATECHSWRPCGAVGQPSAW